jgi:excisionase family DNA binding protein
MESEKLLLRVAEAAELLGVSRAKAYQMAASGAIPTVRLGRATRVPTAALRRWVDEQLEASGPRTPDRSGR